MESILEEAVDLYMMAQFDHGYDPMFIMTLLHAICWAISAWDIDLSTDIICHYFKKALSNDCHGSERSEKDSNEIVFLSNASCSYSTRIFKLKKGKEKGDKEPILIHSFIDVVWGLLSAFCAEPVDNDHLHSLLGCHLPTNNCH